MTASLNGSNTTHRRGPRHAFSGELVSPALVDFREHTDGLSTRLRLPSLSAMRAGSVLSPHGAVRRYLLAGRAAGLPKEWATKFLVFVQRTIDSQWPMEQTSRVALEEKANRLEYLDGCAEKKLDLEGDLISLRERIQTKTNEVTADLLLLARLEREMEDAK